MEKVTVVSESGFTFSAYLADAPKHLYPFNMQTKTSSVYYIPFAKLLETLCGDHREFHHTLLLPESILYFRKGVKQFVHITTEEIQVQKLSLQDAYICYHQLTMIMHHILTQIIKTILNVDGDARFRYEDPEERMRSSALNIILFCHSLEHQFYDSMPMLIEHPPERFKVNSDAASRYAQCGIDFVSKLQNNHALSYTWMRSMAGKAAGADKIPLVVLCAEGFIVYMQPTCLTSFLPFRATEAQRAILTSLDTVEKEKWKANADAKAAELLALLDEEASTAATVREQQEEKKAAKRRKKKRAQMRRAEAAASSPPDPVTKPLSLPTSNTTSLLPPAQPAQVEVSSADGESDDESIEIIIDDHWFKDMRLYMQRLNANARPFQPSFSTVRT